MAQLRVVVSHDQVERDTEAGEECREVRLDLGREAGGGVEQIPGDDEAPGAGLGDERGQPPEVAREVAFRDRNAVGAERGGLAKVEVGDDQGAGCGVVAPLPRGCRWSSCSKIWNRFIGRRG